MASFNWHDKTVISIDELRKKKEKELSEKCQQEILDGFKYTFNDIEYHFSFDFEAQLNFQGAERILKQGLIQTLKWTVRNGDIHERIDIDESMMDELTVAILQHKNLNISKFRDELYPLILAANTQEELDEIRWEESE